MLHEAERQPAQPGLLPTPPMPSGLGRVELSENARQVFERRYARRGRDGELLETAEATFWRVAYHVAKAEETWNGDALQTACQFYELLSTRRFFPNSPTFTGAGTPLGQLAACFVLPITDDMGRDPAGIFQTLRDAALIQQTGGGNGFSFSRLRPKGTLVRSSAGQATGPVGFLRVYDKAFGEIAQGGTRRGANMGVLRVDHPDIEEFITCKTDENAITNFNISVGITDAFMQAVREDRLWELRFPDVSAPEYSGFNGTLEQAEQAGIPIKVHRRVRALDLFEKIVRQAHHNGEPGVLFLDTANRSNPVPHLYPLEATNPCFDGSTRIATQQGLLRIDDLAERGEALLLAVDDRAPFGGIGSADRNRQGLAFRAGSPAWMSRQRAPVLRLVTRHGYRVTATPDHKFLTAERGYVELGCLKPGDRLLIQSAEGAWSRESRLPNREAIRRKLAASLAMAGGRPAAGSPQLPEEIEARLERLPEEWSHELGLVLGCLVGQGRLDPASDSPVSLAFRQEEASLLQAVQEALEAWFGPALRRKSASALLLGYGRLPYEFFASLGVEAGPAQRRRLPESLWSAPRQAVVGFLQGLFTSVGAVEASPTGRSTRLRLASASPQLLEDIQLLLSNFGIISRLRTRRGAGELLIEKASRARFLQEIGFLDEAKQRAALALCGRPARRLSRETFETIVSRIEPAGETQVYDLTEPVTHSVIANGLVAHQCGEQWLGPYENCCLGSVNLAQHFGPQGSVDWEKLQRSVELATRFLDDVVQVNAYVPAVPWLQEAAFRARRIGLGIMGLADLMYHARIRYGSEEGQEFAAQVMEFVRYHSMRCSVELARERGPFEAIAGSIYDPADPKWQPPQPLVPYRRDWGRPALDWSQIEAGIRRHGIRNAAQTTVAPTGTIATVAGCEGYGCEPVFALAYIRHVNDNGKDLPLSYMSPLFENALLEAGLDEETRAAIIEQVMEGGTCQGIELLPEEIRNAFVISQDIRAEEHVRMQAAMQAFVDNSLSKTINFPEDATEQDVATAYQLAWELGCKGITVYVTGSRQHVVLETNAVAREKQPPGAEKRAMAEEAEQLAIWHEKKKPRPRSLPGYTYKIDTPLGKAFVTINENGGGQPFEVFVNTSKAGSETAAVSEAIGRLISYTLRLASPIAPRERLKEIWRQLSGIGGGRPLGFGPKRVRSLPDGVAQALGEYLENVETDPQEQAEEESGDGYFPELGFSGEQIAFRFGDLCPECGQAGLVNEEGCRKCYACGYSEC